MVEKSPLYIQPIECLFLVFFPDAVHLVVLRLNKALAL